MICILLYLLAPFACSMNAWWMLYKGALNINCYHTDYSWRISLQTNYLHIFSFISHSLAMWLLPLPTCQPLDTTTSERYWSESMAAGWSTSLAETPGAGRNQTSERRIPTALQNHLEETSYLSWAGQNSMLFFFKLQFPYKPLFCLYHCFFVFCFEKKDYSFYVCKVFFCFLFSWVTFSTKNRRLIWQSRRSWKGTRWFFQLNASWQCTFFSLSMQHF